MVRLQRPAQFHVAMQSWVERQMVSRASSLPTGPLFRGASPRNNRGDSGLRTELRIPEQENLFIMLNILDKF